MESVDKKLLEATIAIKIASQIVASAQWEVDRTARILEEMIKQQIERKRS